MFPHHAVFLHILHLLQCGQIQVLFSSPCIHVRGWICSRSVSVSLPPSRGSYFPRGKRHSFSPTYRKRLPPLVPSSPQPAGAERYRGGSYSPSQEDTSSSNGRSGISGWNNLHHRSGLSSASASNLEHTCSAPSKARDACSRSSSTWERSPGSEDGRRLGIRVLQRRGGERLWV